jgi:hypothetical protein
MDDRIHTIAFARIFDTEYVVVVSAHELWLLQQTHDTLNVDPDGRMNRIFDKPPSHLISLSDYAHLPGTAHRDLWNVIGIAPSWVVWC